MACWPRHEASPTRAIEVVGDLSSRLQTVISTDLIVTILFETTVETHSFIVLVSKYYRERTQFRRAKILKSILTDKNLFAREVFDDLELYLSGLHAIHVGRFKSLQREPSAGVRPNKRHVECREVSLVVDFQIPFPCTLDLAWHA